MVTGAGGQYRINPINGEAGGALHLHIQNVSVSLNHAVPGMQRGLKANLCLLNRHHGLLQAHFFQIAGKGGAFQANVFEGASNNQSHT